MKEVGAIVLAGGQGRRLARDKGGLPVAGTPIVARVVEAAVLAAERVVVVGDAPLPAGIDLPVVPDEVPRAGPLHGLLLGLRALGTPLALLLAWDMPFVTSELLRYLTQTLGDCEAAVPLVEGRPQPLCAAYAQSCASQIEGLGDGINRPMRDLLARVWVRWVEEAEIRRFGDPRRLFFNVNTQADLDLAQMMAAQD
jgi:molybdopterin-guanine dinucleotide biosynthesis protein A